MTPQEIQNIPEYLREELNHQAYLDVFYGNPPTRYNEYYRHCYRQWKAISPDPYDEY